jgi:hypothetical protein
MGWRKPDGLASTNDQTDWFMIVYRWDGYIASNMSWNVMDLSQTRGWADGPPFEKALKYW